jgi:hypothetical protein
LDRSRGAVEHDFVVEDVREEELGGVLQSSSRHLRELQQLTGVALTEFLGKQRELIQLSQDYS